MSRVLSTLLATTLLLAGAQAQQSGGLLVAVGDQGRRVTSTDGIHWEGNTCRIVQSDSFTLSGIAFGLGRFVAVGGDAKLGHILVGRVGTPWQLQGHWPRRITSICFGGPLGAGRFIASDAHQLLLSRDGDHFEAGLTLPVEGTVRVLGSVFGSGEAGSRFVLVGDVDQGDGRKAGWRLATEDGTSIQSLRLDAPPARAIAYGAGHFVIVGAHGLIESSHDGQNWQTEPSAPASDFSGVIWTGTRFFASGSPADWSSSDGINWKPEQSSSPGAIMWGREEPSPLGLTFTATGELLFSQDFVHWERAPLPPGPALKAIASALPP